MADPKNLRNFLDGAWPVLRKYYDDELLSNIQESWIMTLKAHKKETIVGDVREILETLSLAYPTTYMTGECIPAEDKDFNCQIMLYKPTGEKIPVYVTEGDLQNAVSELKGKFNLLLKTSNKAWKFAIASNLKRWVIYGANTTVDNAPLTSNAIFEIQDRPKKKSLNPLIRDLLAIIRLGLQERFASTDEQNIIEESKTNLETQDQEKLESFFQSVAKAEQDPSLLFEPNEEGEKSRFFETLQILRQDDRFANTRIAEAIDRIFKPAS